MNNWLTHTLNERKVMLRETAKAEHLPDYAVEKDWWVTIALLALFQTSVAPHLLFKGGTSLSKGWSIIQRFSEDIDLALSHRYNMTQRHSHQRTFSYASHMLLIRF